MSKETPATEPDGRRLRGERNKQAIIEALIAMIDEGNLVPTAQQVAERAQVGIRSVFRHFDDMENLFALANEQNRDIYQKEFTGGKREGSLDERIQRAMEQHAKGYERFSNAIRMTMAQRWKYDVLDRNFRRHQRALRNDLDNWLPELEEIGTVRREAVDGIASFDMWYRLRDLQGLSKKATIEVIVCTLKALINSPR